MTYKYQPLWEQERNDDLGVHPKCEAWIKAASQVPFIHSYGYWTENTLSITQWLRASVPYSYWEGHASVQFQVKDTGIHDRGPVGCPVALGWSASTPICFAASHLDAPFTFGYSVGPLAPGMVEVTLLPP